MTRRQTFYNLSRRFQKQMIIGDRLRELREERKFSQGEIEKRTGLLRCYISRVEHGYTVPNVETLEKLARGLEVPIYQLFYEGAEPPKLSNFLNRKKTTGTEWGRKGEDARQLAQFRRLFSGMAESDRRFVLFMAQKMARRKAV
jgi:transcriptional regulator with XRE-family HTH domain